MDACAPHAGGEDACAHVDDEEENERVVEAMMAEEMIAGEPAAATAPEHVTTGCSSTDVCDLGARGGARRARGAPPLTY